MWSASGARRAPAKIETRICTSVGADSLRELAEKASVAVSLGSDLVEFRFDMLGEDYAARELEAGVSRIVKRAVFTVRSRDEGGGFRGSEKERLRLISRLAEMRPAFVDIELATFKNNLRWSKSLPEGVEKIVSWHDFGGTPSLERLVFIRDEELRYGSFAKVITTATNVEDNLRTLELLKRKKGRVVAFCMGALGTVSRVISMRLGAPLAYAALPNEALAPGQLSVTTMLRLRSMVS